jgi:cephalosporin hydroxylase
VLAKRPVADASACEGSKDPPSRRSWQTTPPRRLGSPPAPAVVVWLRSSIASTLDRLRLLPQLARIRLRQAALPLLYRPRSREEIIDRFHRLFYDSRLQGGTWFDARWLGTPAQKCPLDLWIYQELLFEKRPDLIIETGTYDGGSALFFASLCDLLGDGVVVTIDIEPRQGRPAHQRINYLTGSSTAPEIVEQVRSLAAGKASVLVVLDSDHRRDHVLAELRAYGEFVTSGSYLVVEDTNVNGHPVAPEHGPGPLEAVERFLDEDRRFVVDRSREKFLLTFNPSGFLRKIAD